MTSVRLNFAALSLSAPAQAPDGKQVDSSAPGAQLQLLLPAGQSATVGTWVAALRYPDS